MNGHILNVIYQTAASYVTFTEERQQPYAVWIRGKVHRFYEDREDAVYHAKTRWPRVEYR